MTTKDVKAKTERSGYSRKESFSRRYTSRVFSKCGTRLYIYIARRLWEYFGYLISGKKNQRFLMYCTSFSEPLGLFHLDRSRSMVSIFYLGTICYVGSSKLYFLSMKVYFFQLRKSFVLDFMILERGEKLEARSYKYLLPLCSVMRCLPPKFVIIWVNESSNWYKSYKVLF